MQKGKPTRIGELLKEKNIPRKAFATYLHVSESTLSRYIDGTTGIPRDTIMRIRDYFNELFDYNVSLDYIYGFDDFTSASHSYIGEVTGLSDKAIIFLSKAHNSKDDFSAKTVNFINYALENDTSSDDPLYRSIFATMWEYITADNNELFIHKKGNKYEKYDDKAYFKEIDSDKMIEIDVMSLYSQERLNKIKNHLVKYKDTKKAEYEQIKKDNELMTFDSGADFMEKWNELTKESKKKGRAKK